MEDPSEWFAIPTCCNQSPDMWQTWLDCGHTLWFDPIIQAFPGIGAQVHCPSCDSGSLYGPSRSRIIRIRPWWD